MTTPVGKCPDCRHAIVWLREASLGVIPVDAKPSPLGVVAMDSLGWGGSVLDGDALERARTEGRHLYTAHQFPATCPGKVVRR